MIDVLVIGAGACGLIAALRARQLGLDVLVVEKASSLAGDSVLSCGSIPAAGTRFQRQAGIDDDVDLMSADLIRQAGAHDAQALVRPLVARSAEVVEWLADHCGVGIHLYTNYKHVGHTVPRLHSQASGSGVELIDSLFLATQRDGIPVRFGMAVVGLLRGADGEVVGASVSRGPGESTGSGESTGPGPSTQIRAKKVIIAAGGFGANKALVARFCPDIAGLPHFGAAANEGDAIEWASQFGAAFGNAGAFQAHAGVLPDESELLTWSVCEKGAFYVNRLGRRFCNENQGYSPCGQAMAAQGNRAFVVFDQRISDYVARFQPRFKALVDAGVMSGGGSIADAARPHGIVSDELQATLERYNAAAAGSATDEFGRSDFGMAPLQAPYRIAAVKAALFHTQGGLMVDEYARVLDEAGKFVPNLLAGGGAAVGVSGLAGGAGYVSGNGLLTATVLGFIAAETAAAELGGTAG